MPIATIKCESTDIVVYWVKLSLNDTLPLSAHKTNVRSTPSIVNTKTIKAKPIQFRIFECNAEQKFCSALMRSIKNYESWLIALSFHSFAGTREKNHIERLCYTQKKISFSCNLNYFNCLVFIDFSGNFLRFNFYYLISMRENGMPQAIIRLSVYVALKQAAIFSKDILMALFNCCFGWSN